MLRKFLANLGLGSSAASGGTGAGPPYAPYSETAANAIYNLLFGDPPGELLASIARTPAPFELVLSSEPANVPALLTLADDPAQDGRIRFLAYARLRALGQVVAAKRLLGVIVETPMTGGLDALAAYSEGSVRYINYTGKMAFFERVPSLQPHVRGLFVAAEPVVARIGPWHEPRQPPPKAGRVRLSFLVSDGLYFGEGPLATMQRDAMAGPVIQKAGVLLQAAVALAVK